MLTIVFIFILGAVIGSFLNLAIYRLPRNESVILPPSRCPKCAHRLGWLDLIPILGYFFLKGKCRYCKTPISFRYPLVEIITALFFVMIYLRFTQPLEVVFYCLFVVILLLIFFIDLEHQVIPDAASYLGIFLGLAFNYIKGFSAFISSLIGVALGFALFYAIARIGTWIFKKEAMGEGDIILTAFLGAFFGWQMLVLSVFITYILAGVFCLILLVFKKVKFGEQIPFGPYLVIGAIIVLFFGEQILKWYLTGIIF